MENRMHQSSGNAALEPETCVKLFLRKVLEVKPVNFWREAKCISRMAGPVFLSQLMVILINIVSSAFCGHLGKIELDAVSLAVAVISISGTSIGIGLSTVCDTLISQTYGRKNLKRIGVILQRGILILLIACFPCWALFINTEHILLALKQPPAVAKLSQLYIWIFIPGLPAFFLCDLETRYLQNQGIIMPQVFVRFITNIFNAVINYLFLYVLTLGLPGSAAANVASQYFQLLLLFGYIRWKKLHVQTWAGCISIVIAVILGATKDVLAYIFISDKEIIHLFAGMFPISASCPVAECFGAVSGGVLRGAGKQNLEVIGNLIGYYVIGFPIGISLMFPAKLGAFVICRMNWKEATDEALVNAVVVKDVDISNRTKYRSTDVDTGNRAMNPIPDVCQSEVQTKEDRVMDTSSIVDTGVTTVREILSTKQLIIRRGLAFLSGHLNLAIGLMIHFILAKDT
ncbi:LOW QUALITY PROTEIN: multidrug and toxin extrusion protein 2-like [Rhincodon typus]|uniref:LOW QUALITY PROTEIN: multidrug and toxin extrusion protein 2-like n=1 Tax=Rhincodon typus TaxID=259920 RepID=UPI00202E5F41|nr:LOW QUALITY PROTEIN: multidrug and toxin extrusion protein 2-like [Rhincodon typus]